MKKTILNCEPISRTKDNYEKYIKTQLLPMFEQSGEDLIKCLKPSNLTEVTQVSIKFVEAGTLV